jgi:hypothetical protein
VKQKKRRKYVGGEVQTISKRKWYAVNIQSEYFYAGTMHTD